MPVYWLISLPANKDTPTNDKNETSLKTSQFARKSQLFFGSGSEPKKFLVCGQIPRLETEFLVPEKLVHGR